MGQGACGLSDDPLCDGTPSSCSDGLSCIDRACVNPCHALTDCPEGSQCVSSGGLARCARADLDAGVAPDAGDAATACHGPGCDPIAEVVVDGTGACARTSNGGAVWCWGRGAYLGVGDAPEQCGTIPCSTRPTQVMTDETGLHAITGTGRIAAGSGVFCAAAPGLVWCWGGAGSPQLGTTPSDGIYARHVMTETGDPMTGIVDLTVGGETAIAMRASDAYVWGANTSGEYGIDPGMAHARAVLVTTIPRGTVRLGSNHGCALAGGVVTCWGANGDGQVVGPRIGASAVLEPPAPVSGLPTQVSDIGVGRDHACAVQNGDVWCWGNGNVLGVAPSMCPMGVSRLACPPTRVTRLDMAYQSLASASNTNAMCAIDTSGNVWCWGEDDENRFPPRSPYQPARITGLPAVQSVSIADGSGCAVDFEGDVWCWGNDDTGELGNGTHDAAVHLTPTRVQWPSP